MGTGLGWRAAAALVLVGGLTAARADEDHPEPWAWLLADRITRDRALDALSDGPHDATRVSTRARQLLADLARDPDWHRRRQAAMALGRARAVEHLELLVELLRDPERLVREAVAMDAIPSVGWDAIAVLHRHVGTAASPAERVYLAVALLRCGERDDATVERLETALAALEPAVVGELGQLALRALDGTTTWRAAELVLRRIEQGAWPPHALHLLAAVADPRAEAALRAALMRRAAEMRSAALTALARREPALPASVFSPHLGDGAAAVRIAALFALGARRALETAPVMARSLVATDAAERRASGAALLALGDGAHEAVIAVLATRKPRIAGPLEVVIAGEQVWLGDSDALERDEQLRRLFRVWEGGRRLVARPQVCLAPGLFGLVHRHGTHTWDVVVAPVASARTLATIDGSTTLAAMAEHYGAKSAAHTVLTLAAHDLVDWTGRPGGAPFEAMAVPHAGAEAPTIAGVVPCFWGE